MTRPALGPQIEVLGELDLEELWSRFEVFEALHHTMSICNPMSSEQLDEAIDSIELAAGARVLDVACGYGEVLLRAARQTDIAGMGIDLSPWMIGAAAERSEREAPTAELQWILGEARDFVPEPAVDVAVCIGAEWVWHDLHGTIRALGKRVAAGGVIVVGGARRHFAATEADVAARGRIETVPDIEEMFANNGMQVRHRIDPDDAGWDAYLDRTAKAAAEWAKLSPGPRTEQFIDEQVDWQSARERDREIIGWSLWVAQAMPEVAR